MRIASRAGRKRRNAEGRFAIARIYPGHISGNQILVQFAVWTSNWVRCSMVGCRRSCPVNGPVNDPVNRIVNRLVNNTVNVIIQKPAPNGRIVRFTSQFMAERFILRSDSPGYCPENGSRDRLARANVQMNREVQEWSQESRHLIQ